MADPDPKALLNQKLSLLLGFSDGVSDILDYLLTIETSEELLDYFSQFLGANNEQIRSFVDDVTKVRRGETISPHVTPIPDATIQTSADADRIDATAISPVGKVTANERHKKVEPEQPADKGSQQSQVVELAPQVAKSASQTSKAEKTTQSEIESNSTEKHVGMPRKTHPPKGRAPFECGCFGNLHEPLANCLYCGRISCEREGYNYCPFCGYLVEEVKPPEDLDAPSASAWRHKERLLRYDRDFAQRAVIIDDHADYFASGAWLNEEEKEKGAEEERVRLDQLHRRKKMELNLGGLE